MRLANMIINKSWFEPHVASMACPVSWIDERFKVPFKLVFRKLAVAMRTGKVVSWTLLCTKSSASSIKFTSPAHSGQVKTSLQTV